MKEFQRIDMLEAAAYALVSERCRPAYLHDIRGGLQALHGGVELLVRTANSAQPDLALAGRAAALARNALQKQEKSLVELLDQTAPRRGSAAAVNVGALVAEVLRFVRNDAASKSIALRFEAPQEILVLAQPDKFRLLLLGLCITLIDEIGAATTVEVGVAPSGQYALVEIVSTLPWPAIREPEELWGVDGPGCSLRDLLLSLTQAWASSHGGRLELSAAAQSPGVARLYYPMHIA